MQSRRRCKPSAYSGNSKRPDCGKRWPDWMECWQPLPEPFNHEILSAANTALEHAVTAHEAAQRAHVQALQQVQSLAALRQQREALSERQAAPCRRSQRIENAISDWTLLARCMSNDGLIALAIDDAGPALSGLANDSCQLATARASRYPSSRRQRRPRGRSGRISTSWCMTLNQGKARACG